MTADERPKKFRNGVITMAVANRVLGEGRLIKYQPHLDGGDDHLTSMVGLVSPVAKRRTILTGIPVGKRGILIAVPRTSRDLEGGGARLAACHDADPAVVLAAGTVRANAPVRGWAGPADLVGCAPGGEDASCALSVEADMMLDRLVRLEIHGPGCACAAVVVAGPGLRAGVGDA
jgi:hypothetical protein